MMASSKKLRQQRISAPFPLALLTKSAYRKKKVQEINCPAFHFNSSTHNISFFQEGISCFSDVVDRFWGSLLILR